MGQIPFIAASLVVRLVFSRWYLPYVRHCIRTFCNLFMAATVLYTMSTHLIKHVKKRTAVPKINLNDGQNGTNAV